MMHRMSKEDEAALLRCQKEALYAEQGKAWGEELFENAKTVVLVGMVDSPTVQQLLWNRYKYTCQSWGHNG